MSTIPPVASTTTTSASGAGVAGALGKDDFLKLLVGQLQHQDPMQPTDSQQWVAQLTQFSMVEQLTNLVRASEQAGGQASTAQAVSLIGKTVAWTDDQGASHTGVVDAVSFINGAPTLTVGGQTGVLPAAVTEVR